MRQFLNTLFITSEEVYFPLDGENVVIGRGGEAVASYLLHTLQSIVSFSYWCFTGTDGCLCQAGDRADVLYSAKGASPRLWANAGKCTAAEDKVPGCR